MCSGCECWVCSGSGTGRAESLGGGWVLSSTTGGPAARTGSQQESLSQLGLSASRLAACSSASGWWSLVHHGAVLGLPGAGVVMAALRRKFGGQTFNVVVQRLFYYLFDKGLVGVKVRTGQHRGRLELEGWICSGHLSLWLRGRHRVRQSIVG